MSHLRLPTRLLLLVAAVLVCAAAAVAAAPAVSSVSCAGGVSSWCSNGATVTFTGTGLPTSGTTTVTLGMIDTQRAGVTCASVIMTSATSLSCTLTVASKFLGSYPVVLTNTASDATTTTTYVGDLLVGAFYEQTTSLMQWCAPPASGTIDVSEVLTGISGDGSIASGGMFTMYGNFSASSVYKLYLYNAQPAMEAGSPGLPKCSNADALTVSTNGLDGAVPNALVCTSLTTVATAMGMYGFLVYNTNTKRYVYGGGSLYLLDVYTTNPTVSRAVASCSDGSASCSSGVSLTLTGTNMNLRTPPSDSEWSHFVNFTVDANPNGLQSGASIVCTTTAVDQAAGSATLSLTISSDVLPGAYPLYVVNQVCNMGMKAPPVWVGNVIVGLSHSVSTSTPWETTSSSTSGSYISAAGPTSVASNSQLTLYGAYTTTDVARYEVRFVDGSSQTLASSSAAPKCAVVSVSSTALRCTYTATAASASTALAPMVYDTTSSTYLQSSLLLDGTYATITFEGTSSTSSANEKHHGPANTAAIACAVVFAVLFLGAVIAIIVLLCCCQVSRRRRVPAELRHVQQQQELHCVGNLSSSDPFYTEK